MVAQFYGPIAAEMAEEKRSLEVGDMRLNDDGSFSYWNGSEWIDVVAPCPTCGTLTNRPFKTV